MCDYACVIIAITYNDLWYPIIMHVYIWIWYTFIADLWFCNQVDYVRQLEPPRPYRSAEVDPGLWSSKEEIRAMARLDTSADTLLIMDSYVMDN